MVYQIIADHQRADRMAETLYDVKYRLKSGAVSDGGMIGDVDAGVGCGYDFSASPDHDKERKKR